MEILKYRGRPIPVAKIPFSIEPGKEIVAKPAPVIENIKPIIVDRETIPIIKPVKGILDNEIRVEMGETFLIVCPLKHLTHFIAFHVQYFPEC